jgi:hypothetical protein
VLDRVRRRDQLNRRRLDAFPLFDQLRSMSVVVSADRGMVSGNVRRLDVVAVRWQAGVEHAQPQYQAG